MTEIPGSRPWILCLANQKGGVGKTTTALDLAAAIEDSSGSAVVFDADPQQSAMEIASGGQLPFQVRPALSPPSCARSAKSAASIRCSSTCRAIWTRSRLSARSWPSADYGIIPTIPERAAIAPTQRTAQIIAAQGLPYKILINLVDPLRGAAPVEQLRELLDSLGLPYFGSFVRRYVAHPQSQLDGVAVTAYRGDRSWRSAVDDVRRVQVELLIELGRLAERTPV